MEWSLTTGIFDFPCWWISLECCVTLKLNVVQELHEWRNWHFSGLRCCLYTTEFSVVSSSSIRCFANNTSPPELFPKKKTRYLRGGQNMIFNHLRMWMPSLLVGALFDSNLLQHALVCASILASAFVFIQASKAWIFTTPRRVDQHGNCIPPGPAGLPILGENTFALSSAF